jgi:glycosyltransferase involved in cell wall biosynthesis
LAAVVQATGLLSSQDLSLHVSACDLLIQPFPDGVSSRRTSAMVGLQHGKAMVTTTGELTEDLWAPSGAVAVAPARETSEFVRLVRRLRENGQERERLGAQARRLYEDHFLMERSIARLRASAIRATPGSA